MPNKLPFKFGKRPAKRLRRTLSLSNYLHMGQVSFPQVQAWERPIDLGMLGNDQVGDCTIAGHYHLRMIQRAVAQAGSPLVVTTEQAIADYSAITGYDPSQTENGVNPTDTGAALTDVLAWYKDKYVAVDVQNVDMVKAANFIFGGLYFGFNVPQSMADQINAGQDPDFQFYPNDKPSGEGHCVNLCGHGRDGWALVSWGKYYRSPWDFWLAWVDECYAPVNPDWIKASGTSPSSLDLQGLLAEQAQF